MTPPIGRDERAMLEHTISTRKRLALIAGFMAVFLAVLLVTTFALHRRARRHLDNELGARLSAVANGLAHAVEIAAPDSLSPGEIDAGLLTLFYAAAAEYALSNVVVLGPDGTTVVDIEGYSEPGEPNPFVELDYSAVALARSGIAAYTNLYKAGDTYMKSAYSPIKNRADEVIGLVGVEAGAAFFDDLKELSRVIVFILGASVIAVVVLGGVFYRQSIALDRAQEAALRRENLATMGRMVANIAHDIRNPLSIIKTSAQRLQRKYRTDDEVFAYISEEVDELNRILTGYLDFAASHAPMRPEPLPAQRVLRRCLLVVEPEIAARGITLRQHWPEGDVVIRADEKRAQQAVMNVIMNAVQAIEGSGHIEISLEAHPPLAVIVVADDGCGIDERSLKDVTKPFFTTRADGSGLGLSIVQSIMEEHGGGLVIRSRPGEGTRVELSFPLAA